MTPRQTEKLKKQIAEIKRILASEKRKFGGYHDGRGLRYFPPRYYIKLEDFTGGFTYLKWFDKNFPDDVGFPDFLFEWAIILFKKGRLAEAEKKAVEAYFSNTYLFDKFFGRPVVPIEKWEGSNLATPAFADYFDYSNQQPALADFSDWLNTFIHSDKFIALAAQFIKFSQQLLTVKDVAARRRLLKQIDVLADTI